MTDAKIDGLLRSGNVDEALRYATARLEEARHTKDDAAVALALLDEARAQAAHGDRDDAVMTVDEAITITRRTFGAHDPRYATALEIGAEIAAEASMPNSAEARFRGALEVLTECGVKGYPLVYTVYHHGLFRREQNDLEGAARAFLVAIEQAREQQDAETLSVAAMALTGLGTLALQAGRAKDARELGDRALELWVQVKQARRFEVADAMALVGSAALLMKEANTATEFLEPACQIYGGCKIDVRAKHGQALTRLGEAYAALGRKEQARDTFKRALEFFREGDPGRIAIEELLLSLAKE